VNRLSEMSWVEIEAYLERDDRVILPLGATEQHGRHLGVGTDHMEAEAIALGAGEKTNVAVAPTLNYGMSHQHLSFAGTLSLRPTTLIAIIEDLLRALYRHGFRRVLVVNGHGGNEASLASAVHLVSDDLHDMRVKTFQWWTDQESYRVVTDILGPQQGSHASPGETAFMLAICPNGVKKVLLSGRDFPVKSSRDFNNVNLFREKYPDGIMGLSPVDATAEAGRALLAKSVEICSRELTEWI
jgi:creatinine amidohydrolase